MTVAALTLTLHGPASAAVTPTSTATSTPSPGPAPAPPAARLVVPGELLFPGASPKLPWPAKGRARLEVPGVGVLGHSGPTVNATPIASVTKVMTAYVVLRDHPLTAAQAGPRIKVRRGEADSYARRRRAGESLVKVRAGERITQRDALEGVLVRSGNNMADIVARWNSGSVKAFVAEMNRAAADLGMTSTRFADAHGLSASSRSSTTDLLRLSRAAMADPAFAAIVRMRTATIPLNRLTNTNKLLGRNGVIGLKTGSTRAAGGCLLFAARDGDVVIHGVVLKAPGPKILTNAMKASERLVVAARRAVRDDVLIRRGTPVAELQNGAGGVRRFAVADDVRTTGWGRLRFRVQLPAGRYPGQAPTTLTVSSAEETVSVPLVPVA